MRKIRERVRHYITQGSRHIPADATRQALLDREELLDLRKRVQALLARDDNGPEVMQRRQGEKRSIYRGSGLDYEESRSYQPGDDFRFMNWRVTARTGELHMKIFREERRPGVVVLLDRRAAMRFGTRVRLKVTQAVRCAAIAGFLARERQASFTACWHDTQFHGLNPVTQEQDLFHVLHTLAAPCPPLFSPPAELHYPQALHSLNAMLTPGSQVYLISDFHDLDNRSRGELLHLAARHDVQAVQITDSGERELPRSGQLRIRDFASETAMLVDTLDGSVRQQYQADIAAHWQMIEQAFHAAGIRHVSLGTAAEAIERDMLAVWP